MPRAINAPPPTASAVPPATVAQRFDGVPALGVHVDVRRLLGVS